MRTMLMEAQRPLPPSERTVAGAEGWPGANLRRRLHAARD